jgi:putative membrane protein
MDWSRFGFQLMATVIYVVLGLISFCIAFGVISRFTKFSIQKEIEEDQNSSLAILIGSVIIGIAIIIAAAIHGT